MQALILISRGCERLFALPAARILDVGTQGLAGPIRIIEGKEVPKWLQYTTLSHCWGGLSIPQLMRKTYKKFRRRINTEVLPRTFRDAIAITRLLRNQYLCIDGLCIAQDDHLDWEGQARQMGQIYRCFYCNLAATAARDGRGGLFRFLDRRPESVTPFLLDVPDLG